MADDPPDPMSEAETRRVLLREAVRMTTAPHSANDPSSLEAMLARISAEVTADAKEREEDGRPEAPPLDSAGA